MTPPPDIERLANLRATKDLMANPGPPMGDDEAAKAIRDDSGNWFSLTERNGR